ncbi:MULTISPECIES: hypothetical protein [unclassified Sphingomonas]|uniref:hypothetical protein n=1 Tax=unclassified Sphingomonas TaxID=196159 RepID=UPI000BD311DF|nr:MAG: hypothetical protein B7Z43_06030 [Sphingomonas sp. 12-62-6]OYX37312.1 MAG: hypothetical protein B7Y98_12715 [Sphingomonas sp. 32-62-10]
MIWLALLVAPPLQTSEVAPEEFRRKVTLNHMCITELPTESGYKEVGLISLVRGENAANVAVTKVKNQPSMFEKGFVTAAKVEKEPNVTRLIASLDGEQQGRPAKLEITLTFKDGDGMGVALNIFESAKETRFFCFPQVPGQIK